MKILIYSFGTLVQQANLTTLLRLSISLVCLSAKHNIRTFVSVFAIKRQMLRETGVQFV